MIKKYESGQNVPVGLGIAISADKQQRIIDRAQSVKSKDEMLSYVRSIVDNNSVT